MTSQSGRKMTSAVNVCASEKRGFLYTLCFILMGSNLDSYSQRQPCTTNSAMMFCTCVAAFRKTYRKYTAYQPDVL